MGDTPLQTLASTIVAVTLAGCGGVESRDKIASDTEKCQTVSIEPTRPRWRGWLVRGTGSAVRITGTCCTGRPLTDTTAFGIASGGVYTI